MRPSVLVFYLHPTKMSSNICYICQEGNEKNNLIESPCDCRGSTGWIHEQCLTSLRRRSEFRVQCMTCRSPWKDYRSIFLQYPFLILDKYELHAAVHFAFFSLFVLMHYILRIPFPIAYAAAWFINLMYQKNIIHSVPYHVPHPLDWVHIAQDNIADTFHLLILIVRAILFSFSIVYNVSWIERRIYIATMRFSLIMSAWLFTTVVTMFIKLARLRYIVSNQSEREPQPENVTTRHTSDYYSQDRAVYELLKSINLGNPPPYPSIFEINLTKYDMMIYQYRFAIGFAWWVLRPLACILRPHIYLGNRQNIERLVQNYTNRVNHLIDENIKMYQHYSTLKRATTILSPIPTQVQILLQNPPPITAQHAAVAVAVAGLLW